MLEKLKETWSLLGVLRRILVTLSKAEKSLASLADSQALALKLSVLQSGGSVEELRAEGQPGGDSALEEDPEQNDGDLAAMERIEADMRRRGREVEEDVDLAALEKSLLLLKAEQEKE